jgi:hypothetical protein
VDASAIGIARRKVYEKKNDKRTRIIKIGRKVLIFEVELISLKHGFFCLFAFIMIIDLQKLLREEKYNT